MSIHTVRCCHTGEGRRCTRTFQTFRRPVVQVACDYGWIPIDGAVLCPTHAATYRYPRREVSCGEQ